MEMPRITMQLEGLKDTIQVAMIGQMDEINAYVQEATDKYCSQENLKELIEHQVKTIIDATIKENIDHYYRYGDGQKIIKEVVLSKLVMNEN